MLTFEKCEVLIIFGSALGKDKGKVNSTSVELSLAVLVGENKNSEISLFRFNGVVKFVEDDDDEEDEDDNCSMKLLLPPKGESDVTSVVTFFLANNFLAVFLAAVVLNFLSFLASSLSAFFSAI
jgi:hypothetical protein